MPVRVTVASASGRFKFNFNTEVGPSYVVDSKTNLLQASWVPLSSSTMVVMG